VVVVEDIDPVAAVGLLDLEQVQLLVIAGNLAEKAERF
jgi:hypothetical protein